MTENQTREPVPYFTYPKEDGALVFCTDPKHRTHFALLHGLRDHVTARHAGRFSRSTCQLCCDLQEAFADDIEKTWPSGGRYVHDDQEKDALYAKQVEEWDKERVYIQEEQEGREVWEGELMAGWYHLPPETSPE